MVNPLKNEKNNASTMEIEASYESEEKKISLKGSTHENTDEFKIVLFVSNKTKSVELTMTQSQYLAVENLFKRFSLATFEEIDEELEDPTAENEDPDMSEIDIGTFF